MTQTWADAARLVRCTGFGATGAEVDAATAGDRAAFVTAALRRDGPADPGVVATPAPELASIPLPLPKPTDKQRRQRSAALAANQDLALAWWLNRMVAVRRPMIERLTMAWHGIFATSVAKIRYATMMVRQNETMRALGTGDFGVLALAMLLDPALTLWLDNDENVKGAPNENLAREFMELFTLGHDNGYTEQDVKEAARALSGWTVDVVQATAAPDPATHDDGTKTILGVTGPLDSVQFCEIVVARRESAPFVLGRLWNQLVSDAPLDAATSAAAVAAYGPRHDLAAGIAAMLTSTGFDQARGTRVLSPVEWAVGLARAVGAPPGDATAKVLVAALESLGQVPFRPPSVGGWPAGQAWLSTAAVAARWAAGQAIAGAGDLDAVGAAAPSARLDVVAHQLGVASWSDRSLAALRGVGNDPRDLIAAAAMTPEYATV